MARDKKFTKGGEVSDQEDVQHSLEGDEVSHQEVVQIVWAGSEAVVP